MTIPKPFWWLAAVLWFAGATFLGGLVVSLVDNEVYLTPKAAPSATKPAPSVEPDAPIALRAEPPQPVVDPPRPHLTHEIEVIIAREHCAILKSQCRKDGVCDFCMSCLDHDRFLAGWVATKCKSPSDCVLLETNVEWTRENVNPGWCESD